MDKTDKTVDGGEAVEKEKDKLETYGVKVPVETKQRINELIKQSGLSARGFLESLLDGHEANKEFTRLTLDPAIEKEVEQVDRHLRRLREIFIEKARGAEDLRQEQAGALEGLTQAHGEQVTRLTEQIEKTGEALKATMADNKRLTDRNNELEEVNRSTSKTIALHETTVEELQKKVKDLNTNKILFHTAQDELREIKQELQLARDALKDKDLEMSKQQYELQAQHARELQAAQNELHNLYNERLASMTAQVNKFRDTLDTVKEEKYSLQAELSALKLTFKNVAPKKRRQLKVKKKGNPGD